MPSKPEILAPAGDLACLDAALRAGADAIYFGLDAGFNARARATNLSAASLCEVMDRIHDYGRRGYLTLNTLVFDDELTRVERLIHCAADAGVDAVIVQDLAVARLVKRMVPSLRLHASTQSTCTDHAAIALLAELGAERITLARELSLREISELVAASPVELEIFAHGALCISYSGQCLTSEAIGGRSANRGACAQACRLPYGLLVDEVPCDLADVAYLLSPRDLDTSKMVPDLRASGVAAIKIEGRLKGADYVAATTRLYRLAVDDAAAADRGLAREQQRAHAEIDPLRELSAQSFSRGSSSGFLGGINHQALVDGTTCDHIGVEVGRCLGVQVVAGRAGLGLHTERRLARGDGILIQGGRAGAGELGGRIWQMRHRGHEIESCERADDLWLWLGPERRVAGDYAGRRVFRTSASSTQSDLATLIPIEPERIAVSAQLVGAIGEASRLSLETTDGRRVEVTLDQPLEAAHTRALDAAAIREKLERLGDTSYRLGQLDVELPPQTILPLSSLNRGRRAAAAALRQAAHRPHVLQSESAIEQEISWPKNEPPPRGLFVTCRTREQAEAALGAGAQGIYLDFLALTGTGDCLRGLRSRYAASLGVALPRIRKPGEEKIDAYLLGLEPDLVLVRSLGSLASIRVSEQPPTWVGDFSLNVTNSLAAGYVLTRNLAVFTPGYDLDAAQLLALLDSPLASHAEVVIHHPMPLFHMEHCIFAALLSTGKDHRDCGRPCERHVIALRDRTGMELPVAADVGCRNTVFHGVAQSAADLVSRLVGLGVVRFRVELVRETPAQTEELVRGYAELIAGALEPSALRQRVTALGLRVVRGSLRTVG